jgi:hypothetical protein
MSERAREDGLVPPSTGCFASSVTGNNEGADRGLSRPMIIQQIAQELNILYLDLQISDHESSGTWRI